MSEEINIQDTPIDVNQTVTTDIPVTDADVPTNVATDTPVSDIGSPSQATSSTPISEPIESPVVTPPVVQSAPSVVQNAPTPTTDKFFQNQSLWQKWLQRALANKEKKRFDNINKVYQYILKKKKATVRDVQLLLLCRRRTAENYLDALIKQSQIKRVGEVGNNKAYYEPIN